MTLLDFSTIVHKLGYLQENIEKLREYRMIGRREFLADTMIRDAVERRLQTGIQSVLDCSHLLVTIENWRPPRSDEHAILLLAAHKVISAKLAKKLISAHGLRNILVHEYTRVDPKKVYTHLQKDFSDLIDYARTLAAYISKRRP